MEKLKFAVWPSNEAYTADMLKIDNALSHDHFEQLRFLCRDIAPTSSLDISQPRQVFQKLEGVGYLNRENVSFLADVLWRIGRKDLVKKYLVSDVTHFDQFISSTSRIPSFRILLHDLCQGMLDKTLKLLVDVPPITELSRQEKSKITSPQQLFITMDQHDMLKKEIIVNMLQMVWDQHLLDILASHRVTEPAQKNIPYYRHHNGSTDIHDVPQPFLHEQQNFIQDGAIPCYKMTSRPRGHCLIISNENFVKSLEVGAKTLRRRQGAAPDIANLTETFQSLGFVVTLYIDLNHKQMEKAVYELTRDTDHTEFDVFVCCVLTHGDNGKLYGADGLTVTIESIVQPSKPSSCRSLEGKPKLFFFQACQGTEKQEVHPGKQEDIEEDSAAEIVLSSLRPEPSVAAPNEADLLIFYATVPGFVSYRHKTLGTFFISALCRALNEHARPEPGKKHYDLLSILTDVNRQVAENTVRTENGSSCKQVSFLQHTLRKLFYFFK